MHYSYKTKGTCSRMIEFDVIDETVHNVKFICGCDGNLTGIGKLVEGMLLDDVIYKLEGISCDGKPTSCPDQLSKALKSVKTESQ